MTKFYRRPKIGLALSGGAGRGNIHIGVLKVLERENIPIDYISATSMGGLIGAAYAKGMSPQALEEEALRMASLLRLLDLVDRKFPNGGLMTGDRIHAYIAQHIGETTTFADLNIPLALVAVDLNSGQEVILKQGNVTDAVRATSAIPGLIAPMEINGYRLVDGGLLNNLPVDVVRQMGSEIVIAVNVTSNADNDFNLADNRFLPAGLGRIANDTYRSLSIAMGKLNQYKLEQANPDILIKPASDMEVNFLTGYTHAAEAIAAGETATEAVLPQIREVIANNQRFSIQIPFQLEIKNTSVGNFVLARTKTINTKLGSVDVCRFFTLRYAPRATQSEKSAGENAS